MLNYKSILIIGGTGFIGLRLSKICVNHGFDFIAFNRYNSNKYWGWLAETGHAERLFGKSVSAAINSITVAKVMDSS